MEPVIERNYPTAPDAEGFFYESAEDEGVLILTKTYENGNKVKRVKLPVCGKIAIVRELIGKDTKDIARFMDNDNEKYQIASIAVATTLDGQKQPFDIFENMKLKDLNYLMSVHQQLNF